MALQSYPKTLKQAELNPTLAHVHFASLIPPVPMQFLERYQTSSVEICHLCKSFFFFLISYDARLFIYLALAMQRVGS